MLRDSPVLPKIVHINKRSARRLVAQANGRKPIHGSLTKQSCIPKQTSKCEMLLLSKLYMGHCTDTSEVKHLSTQIKTKVRGYEQQDKKMDRDTGQNITSDETVEKLIESSMTCNYCSDCVTTQYTSAEVSHDTHSKQWTLDRINNALPHTKQNTLVACLSCNVRRGRMSHDAFVKNTNGYFSKCIRLRGDVKSR